MVAVNQLRASISTIETFKNQNSYEARQALLYEIYQFQLEALATITLREDLKTLIANFSCQKSRLDTIFSEIDDYPLILKISILETQQAFYQWMLLISLLILYPSILLILFTGPIAFMLGLIGCSAFVFVLSALYLFQKSDELFLHQEGLKALYKPFYLRTKEDEGLEINQTVKYYETLRKIENVEEHWYHPLPGR